MAKVYLEIKWPTSRCWWLILFIEETINSVFRSRQNLWWRIIISAQSMDILLFSMFSNIIIYYKAVFLSCETMYEASNL